MNEESEDWRAFKNFITLLVKCHAGEGAKKWSSQSSPSLLHDHANFWDLYGIHLLLPRLFDEVIELLGQWNLFTLDIHATLDRRSCFFQTVLLKLANSESLSGPATQTFQSVCCHIPRSSLQNQFYMRLFNLLSSELNIFSQFDDRFNFIQNFIAVAGFLQTIFTHVGHRVQPFYTSCLLFGNDTFNSHRFLARDFRYFRNRKISALQHQLQCVYLFVLSRGSSYDWLLFQSASWAERRPVCGIPWWSNGMDCCRGSEWLVMRA
jgi:hypothetical protein